MLTPALALDDGGVIELHRVAYAGDRPVEYFVAVMAADRQESEHDVPADD